MTDCGKCLEDNKTGQCDRAGRFSEEVVKEGLSRRCHVS